MRTTPTLLTAALLTIISLSEGFAVGEKRALSSTKLGLASNNVEKSNVSVDYEIRRAHDEDIEILAALLARKRDFDRDLNGEDFSKAMQPRQGVTLNTLYPGLPQSKVMFIGEPDAKKDDYIGFATFGTKHEGFGRPYFWLEDIFIDPSRRSGGAGTKMMECLADEASKLGCTHMWWIVDQGNARGIDFYRKLGAEIDCRDHNEGMHRMKWVPSTLA